jgi:hypothetical protein
MKLSFGWIKIIAHAIQEINKNKKFLSNLDMVIKKTSDSNETKTKLVSYE